MSINKIRGIQRTFCLCSEEIIACFSFSSAQAHQGPNADPLSGECRQSPPVFKGATGPSGKHGLPRYCRWQPPTHAGPHLDNHPPLPGMFWNVPPSFRLSPPRAAAQLRTFFSKNRSQKIEREVPALLSFQNQVSSSHDGRKLK